MSLSVFLSERVRSFLKAFLCLCAFLGVSLSVLSVCGRLCISLNVSGALRVFLHVRLRVPEHF